MTPPDLLQRLRERAATLSANHAEDTARLLREAAEALEDMQRMLAAALPALESHWDEGPSGEGWQSDALHALVTRIRDLASPTGQG